MILNGHTIFLLLDNYVRLRIMLTYKELFVTSVSLLMRSFAKLNSQ